MYIHSYKLYMVYMTKRTPQSQPEPIATTPVQNNRVLKSLRILIISSIHMRATQVGKMHFSGCGMTACIILHDIKTLSMSIIAVFCLK